jgi:hypothetical protein
VKLKDIKFLLSPTEGFVGRVIEAFKVVSVHQARKYFRSTRRFMQIYKEEGATGKNINQLARQKRAHRSARLAPEERRKSGDYNRSRILQCRI